MSINVKFFYKNQKPDNQRETIIYSFTNLIGEIISLPDEIEVCLYPLEENVYGGIDVNRVNRIGLNVKLSYMDIPKILTHELIHVNQKHLGTLRIDYRGMCYWRGIPYTNKDPDVMTYEEYMNLPWEVDVQERQSKLLSEALQKYNNKG